MSKLLATRTFLFSLATTVLIGVAACTNAGEQPVTHTPEGADSDLRAEMGFPPKRDDWSFEVSPGEGNWSYRLMMFEGAEQYLGTQLFESLPSRFSSIPGVEAVEQEDRESYLIRSKLSPDELEDQLWLSFTSASSEAFAH